MLAKSAGVVSDVISSVPGLGWAVPNNENHPFTAALQQVAEGQMRNEAMGDVRNTALAGLGVGAGAAGLAGLYRMLKKKEKKRVDPMMPLPYPIERSEKRSVDEEGRPTWADRGGQVLRYGGATGGGILAGAHYGKKYGDQLMAKAPDVAGIEKGIIQSPDIKKYFMGVTDEASKATALANAEKALAANPQVMAAQQARRGMLSKAMWGLGGRATLGGLAGAAGMYGLSSLLGIGPKSWPKSKYDPSKFDPPAGTTPSPATMPKQANISMKAGIPWYGPAMLFGGLGGAALGWKGVDTVLKNRAKKEREAELEAARGEFHDALMSQYDKPLKSPPKLAADAELGRELDRLFDMTQKALEKTAANMSDLGGMALGGYGAYAGLSGLLAGSLVYNQMKKRSRAAIIEKAIQKRERRKFEQSPSEIYAVPEPMDDLPIKG